ncbi:hypothetical protein E2P81_ATG09944 [Venturia nashicola]|uniref:Uncharacterized protein n=1 Tax=Venturia nashicola TaxID=86259 RepID=A0A4Z1NZA6_9PEZI|nr:hypothetical protein E6O75_ATG10163 [Venturia nashicola]TLD15096.1 hypothetical protein E2P81_ATG09944 [Venturia nashicola]
MDRYPHSPRDDIFTLARRITPARDREYIRELEEGMITAGRVMDSYKDETRRLRIEVDGLREKIYGRIASTNGGKIDERRSHEADARGRKLVMETEDGEGRIRDWENEQRRTRSRSNIGVKRDAAEGSSPRYEVHESVRATRDLEGPATGFEAPMGQYTGHRDYKWTRDHAENAIDVWDHTYPREPKPEPAPEHRTKVIPNDENIRRQTYQERPPAKRWELPMENQRDEKSGRRNRRYDQGPDNIGIGPKIREHIDDQGPLSKQHSEHQPRSISSDKSIVWQGTFSPFSSQSTEHPPFASSVWERRETLDGLYCYYLNTKDGRMSDPQPLPREESEGEESDLSKLRAPRQSPPVSRTGALNTSWEQDNSLVVTMEKPYRNKDIHKLGHSAKEPVQVLGSTSTNDSKPSRSSADNLPPSPRSYYRNPTAAHHDLRRSVFRRPSMSSQAILPRAPIGVYVNREYAQKSTPKKDMGSRKLVTKSSAPPALQSTSNTTSKISEVFPPSPRSHYGYTTTTTTVPKAMDQGRARDKSNELPSPLLETKLSTFAEAYGESRGNYNVPFVNTVTDIDERERRNRDVLRVTDAKFVTSPSVGKEELVVPIRPRANTRGSGLDVETEVGRNEEGSMDREYKNGGKVRRTGSA